jgi:hypothetical protein
LQSSNRLFWPGFFLVFGSRHARKDAPPVHCRSIFAAASGVPVFHDVLVVEDRPGL